MDVFFLCRARHQQMVFHQPSQQFGVVLIEEMIGGKGAGVGNAFGGMVAATAFGDVVKQRGQIQHVFALKRMHQPRSKRQLVAVCIHC